MSVRGGIALIMSLAISLATPLSATEYGGLPGAYLRFGSSARALGLGGLDVVLGEGSGAAYGNPAQIGFLQDYEFSATHASLYEGSLYHVLTFAAPWTRWGGVSLGVVSLGCGGFEQRGPTDNRYSIKGEEFSDSQTGLLMGWGTEFSRVGYSLSLASRVKLVNHAMLEKSAWGFGADMGLEHRFVFPYVHRYITPLQVGAHFSNLLQPALTLDEESESFPSRLSLGIGYSVGERATAGIEFAPIGSGGRRIRGGIELRPREEIRLRAGMNSAEITGGFGIRWRDIAVDYAVSWHEELSTSHRVSLALRRPSALVVEHDGEIDPRASARWVVQHYTDPEAARLAHLLASSGDEGNAGRYYRFVVGEHLSTQWAAYGWKWFGDRDYSGAKWAGAEANYLRLLGHAHRDVSATDKTWFRLGDASERLEHWANAVQGYELVIASGKTSVLREQSYFRAGAVYFLHLHDYLSTIRIYEGAIGFYPGHDLSDAYFRLGRSYAALERWQSSVERLEIFLDRYQGDPRVPDGLFWLGRGLYELGLPEDALPKLEEVVEGYPRHEVADDAILYKGHCRRLMGSLSMARLEYSRVVKDFPARDSSPLAQLALAMVLEEEGSLEVARREFRRFIANYPNHPRRSEASQHLQAMEGGTR